MVMLLLVKWPLQMWLQELAVVSRRRQPKKQRGTSKRRAVPASYTPFSPIVFETGGAVNRKFVDFCGMTMKKSMGAFHQSIPIRLSYLVSSTTAFHVK